MHPESSYCAEDVCYMELSFTFVVVVDYRKLRESRSFPLQSICWFNCMRALIILVVAEFYVWLLLVPRMFVIGAYSSSYNFGFFAVALRATIHETGHCVRFKQCCATRFYYCFQRVWYFVVCYHRLEVYLPLEQIQRAHTRTHKSKIVWMH